MRHPGQELIDTGHAQSKSKQGKRNRSRRKWMIEGSFGQAVRHHFKRSLYRRLWRQQIQDWIIATVQNIKKLIQTNRYEGSKTDFAAQYGGISSFFEKSSFHYALIAVVTNSNLR